MDTIIDQLAKISKAGTKLANFLQGRSDDISEALSTLVQRPTVHQYCQTDGTGALHVEVQATVTTLSFRGQAGNSQLPPKQPAPTTDQTEPSKQPSQTTNPKLPPRSPAATNPPTKPVATNQQTKPTPTNPPTKPTSTSHPLKSTSNSQQWGRTATVWPSKAAPSPFKPRPPSQAVAQQPSNGRAKSKHPQVLPPDASDSDDELPPRAVQSQVVVPADSTLAPKNSRRPDHAPPRDERRPSPKHHSGDNNRPEDERHATKRQYKSASIVPSDASSGDEQPPAPKKPAPAKQRQPSPSRSDPRAEAVNPTQRKKPFRQRPVANARTADPPQNTAGPPGDAPPPQPSTSAPAKATAPVRPKNTPPSKKPKPDYGSKVLNDDLRLSDSSSSDSE